MHKVFGEGIVVKCDDSYVEIGFSSLGKKMFIFPDAFGTYLKLVDKKTAAAVGKLVQKSKQESERQIRQQQKLKILQEKERKRLQRERLAKKRRICRLHPRSQSVFWCETQEQDSIFTNWSVFTGVIESGPKKGRPKRLAQISQNSACLLTARECDIPETKRRILGAFMVSENFSPKRCEDGYVPAHPKYRLRLSAQESEKLLFWNYYINERYPHKTTWNTGRHRYFDNMWMAQILKDVVALRKESQDEESAEQFLQHFCRMNRINKEEIPNPTGALTAD